MADRAPRPPHVHHGDGGAGPTVPGGRREGPPVRRLSPALGVENRVGQDDEGAAAFHPRLQDLGLQTGEGGVATAGGNDGHGNLAQNDPRMPNSLNVYQG